MVAMPIGRAMRCCLQFMELLTWRLMTAVQCHLFSSVMMARACSSLLAYGVSYVISLLMLFVWFWRQRSMMPPVTCMTRVSGAQRFLLVGMTAAEWMSRMYQKNEKQ